MLKGCFAMPLPPPPLPQFVDAQHPAAYRPINWGDFRQQRFAGGQRSSGARPCAAAAGCERCAWPPLPRRLSWLLVGAAAAIFAGDYADQGEEVQISHYRLAQQQQQPQQQPAGAA